MSERTRREPGTDFTAIDGVGSKTAKALGAAGMASMAELAAMSVDNLVALLDDVGTPTPASKVISKRWLQQAWQLSRSEVVVDDDDDLTKVAPGTEDGPPEWEEYAGYFIYFDRAQSSAGERWRTRVWDTRNLVEDEFPGTAPGSWISLVLGRANLPASAHTPSPTSFEVGGATIEYREVPEGRQTWLRAEVVIDVQQHQALEAALGSALLNAIVPEMEQRREQ